MHLLLSSSTERLFVVLINPRWVKSTVILDSSFFLQKRMKYLDLVYWFCRDWGIDPKSAHSLVNLSSGCWRYVSQIVPEAASSAKRSPWIYKALIFVFICRQLMWNKFRSDLVSQNRVGAKTCAYLTPLETERGFDGRWTSNRAGGASVFVDTSDQIE